MKKSTFYAYCAALILSAYKDSGKLIPASASSNIETYPPDRGGE